jgi:MFS transporter, FHS family, glucose/mannose:H+ symporter
MLTTETRPATASSRALTFIACASFVPIGIVTVLLGPLLPTLSARWNLDYAQAGALFPAQFWASTVAVGLSGMLVARFGFRFAIKAGLALTSVSVAALMAGSRLEGMICIAGYGAGVGLAVPAANILVAEINPERRSSALNTLNFCWSVGAVACPFLVAAAAKNHCIPMLVLLVAGLSLIVAIAVALLPSSVTEPSASADGRDTGITIEWKLPSLYVLGALFFVYVGTESAFGMWSASYAKSLGTLTTTMAVMTPSFFYAALMLGRWVAPLVLRRIEEVKLAQAGLLAACAGMAGLLLSHSLGSVMLSASLAGLGFSSVYPITISLLTREFGPAALRVASLMFTLANLGGGCLPWLVGISSTQLGSLKVGLTVPLLGGVLMYGLFLRHWKPTPIEQTA